MEQTSLRHRHLRAGVQYINTATLLAIVITYVHLLSTLYNLTHLLHCFLLIFEFALSNICQLRPFSRACRARARVRVRVCVLKKISDRMIMHELTRNRNERDIDQGPILTEFEKEIVQK